MSEKGKQRVKEYVDTLSIEEKEEFVRAIFDTFEDNTNQKMIEDLAYIYGDRDSLLDMLKGD